MIVNRSTIQRYKDAGWNTIGFWFIWTIGTTEICKEFTQRTSDILIDEMQAGVNVGLFILIAGLVWYLMKKNWMEVLKIIRMSGNLSKRDRTAEYYSERLLNRISKK